MNAPLEPIVNIPGYVPHHSALIAASQARCDAQAALEMLTRHLQALVDNYQAHHTELAPINDLLAQARAGADHGLRLLTYHERKLEMVRFASVVES